MPTSYRRQAVRYKQEVGLKSAMLRLLVSLPGAVWLSRQAELATSQRG